MSKDVSLNDLDAQLAALEASDSSSSDDEEEVAPVRGKKRELDDETKAQEKLSNKVLRKKMRQGLSNLCFSYLTGSCKFDEMGKPCLFSHVKPEEMTDADRTELIRDLRHRKKFDPALAKVAQNLNIPMCRMYKKTGQCKQGEKCKFWHLRNELDARWKGMDYWCGVCYLGFTSKEQLEDHKKDMGIMIGGPLTRSYDLLQSICSAINAGDDVDDEKEKRSRRAFPMGKEKLPDIKHPVEELEVSEFSFERFLTEYFIPQKPVKIRGLVSNWPGVSSWADPDHWTGRKFGERLVPIEVGGYMSSNYSQQLMKLKDYVEEHLMRGSAEVGDDDQRVAYLAEYEIFNQLRELEDEVQPVPDACFTGEKGIVRRLLFFGPAGTASPTHRDVNDNILCQVLGCKYLRLFSPSREECLYPLHRGILTNNSTLPTDITTEFIDPEKYPLYSKAVYSEVVLNAGDALFLPSNWWHFVKSYQ
ncbi:DNA-(apurinic or apyrimidinic site) lyase, partial [Perkinsus chesapeaki]